MAKPYPWFFVIDGRVVKVVDANDVRVADPATGVMVPDPTFAKRVAARGAGVEEITRDVYMEKLDAVRQPVLSRLTAMTIQWERVSGGEVEYRYSVDGHELGIRMGDFPDEGLYQLRIDGDEIFEIDDWPAAWTKPPVPGAA